MTPFLPRSRIHNEKGMPLRLAPKAYTRQTRSHAVTGPVDREMTNAALSPDPSSHLHGRRGMCGASMTPFSSGSRIHHLAGRDAQAVQTSRAHWFGRRFGAYGSRPVDAGAQSQTFVGR